MSTPSFSPLRIAPLFAALLTLLPLVQAFGIPEDGSYPNAPLVLGSDGKLYGTTRFGGQNSNGIVFRINRDGTSYEVLHRFLGGSEGAKPESGLVQGMDGNFYGTTPLGGAANAGTVYRITPAGVFVTVHSFADGADGRASKSTLVRAGVDLIGTTSEGGVGAFGTIFRITPAGILTTLVSFDGANGAYPYPGLMLHADGNFYGTTFSGGSSGAGNVFRLTPGGNLTVVQSFSEGPVSAYPLSGLIQGSDGHRYGTTTRTYENVTTSFNRGTIFRLTSAGAFQLLSSFAETGTDGGYPVGNLVEIGHDAAGDVTSFVGVTQYGGSSSGSNGGGTLFRIDAPGNPALPPTPSSKILNLTLATGINPTGGLIDGGDGYFYGAMSNGGNAYSGTIFRMDGPGPSFGKITVLYHLNVPDPPPNDNFANAQPIAGASGSAPGNIGAATVELGEPNHAGISGQHSIWYFWTAPQDGRFVFDTDGSSGGIVLAIYTGFAVNALELVGESGNPFGISRVVLQAVSGTTYRIALATRTDSPFLMTVLNWHAANPPPNDNFVDAQQISGSSGLAAGSNVDASKEPGEPAHATDPGGASIWYKWTASSSGRFQFDAAGTFVNSPLLGIYTGPAVNNLRGLARGLFPTRAQFDAIVGGIYYIAIDASGGATAGDIVLSWQAVPAPQRTYEPYAFTTLAGNPPGNADASGSNARFNRPNAAALDVDGNLYIADTRNHTIRKVTSAGLVTTLAGTPGENGSADGTGAAARFYSPSGVAVGVDGVVYVADSNNNTIREITPAGTVSTLAGSAGFFGNVDGPGMSASFDFPLGIGVDAGGTVYVADSNNHTVRRITPAGQVSTIGGLPGSYGSSDGSGTSARFYHPAGLKFDASGNIYVADQFNYTIRKITPAGFVSTFAGSAGNYGADDGVGSGATFSTVNDVAVDGSGNVYVADQGNHLIRKITPSAAVTTLAGGVNTAGSNDGSGGSARFTSPGGVAATSTGILYVADTGNSTVRSIDIAAAVSTLAGLASPGSSDGSGAAARFSGSRGVGVDSDGNAYIADTSNHSIRKITPAGVTSTLAGLPGVSGSANGTGTAARFNLPRGIAVDASGNVYVADTLNRMIRKITPAGVVSTVAGSTASGSADGTGTAARFRSPGAITLDIAGNLYVADTNNHTIRKITPAAIVTTLAGSATSPGSADGAGSAARFNFPRGITSDGAGNLFVADHDNNTIRKVTPEGVVTTFAGTAGVAGSNDGAASTAHFTNPPSIAADAAGNLYIADRGNLLIRKITPAGAVTTLAGALSQNGSQNGAGSAARFEFPSGIAVGQGGKLYVVDTNNDAVRIGDVLLTLSGAVSRKTHGMAGSFDVNLAISGTPTVECRSGGGSGDYTLVFSFNNQITSGSATVSSGSGTVLGAPAISGNMLSVNLTGVANAQRLTITMNNVTDVSAQVLPATPVSIGFLLGDTTGNGVVTASDVSQTKSKSGQMTDATNFRNDVNLSGSINASDIGLVKSAAGASLP